MCGAGLKSASEACRIVPGYRRSLEGQARAPVAFSGPRGLHEAEALAAAHGEAPLDARWRRPSGPGDRQPEAL